MSDENHTDRRRVLKSVGGIAGTAAFTGITTGSTENHPGHGKGRNVNHPERSRGRSKGKRNGKFELEYEYDMNIKSLEKSDEITKLSFDLIKSNVDDPEDTEIRSYVYEVPHNNEEAIRGGEIDSSGEITVQRGHHDIPTDAEDIITRWHYFGEVSGNCDAIPGHEHTYFGLTFELEERVDSISQAALEGAIGALVGAAVGSKVPGAGTAAGAVGGFIAGIVLGITDYLVNDNVYTIAINEWDQSLLFAYQKMTTVSGSNSYNQSNQYQQTRFGIWPEHHFDVFSSSQLQTLDDEWPSP